MSHKEDAMEPDDPTTLDSQDDRAAVDLSRRRLLLGAAAGALSAPLLRSGAAAATSALSGDGLIREPAGGTVSGGWDWRFKRVRDEFIRNFTDRGEVGAAVSVIAGGRRVIDLWGGVARPATGNPWQQDTIVHVWSCTKGATALCAHILAARGLLDLDALVTDYWPEFGQNGKEATTVAMLLSHQAGVPAIRDPLPAGAFYDTQFMTDTLAAEAPFWEPGSRHGYHALTFGFLVGELVRRISGKTLGEFFRAEVADRFGIDFQMGLPDSEVSRLATVTLAGPPPPPFPIYLIKAFTDPTSIPALVLFNNGGFLAPGEAGGLVADRALHVVPDGEADPAGGVARGQERGHAAQVFERRRLLAEPRLDAVELLPHHEHQERDDDAVERANDREVRADGVHLHVQGLQRHHGSQRQPEPHRGGHGDDHARVDHAL